MPVLELQDNVARLPIRAPIALALKDNLMAIGHVVGDIEHEVRCSEHWRALVHDCQCQH